MIADPESRVDKFTQRIINFDVGHRFRSDQLLLHGAVDGCLALLICEERRRGSRINAPYSVGFILPQ
jgi:hypothetical protein